MNTANTDYVRKVRLLAASIQYNTKYSDYTGAERNKSTNECRLEPE